jgi:hypothetical protein
MEFDVRKLGGGYYLEYRETSNGMGGFHPVDIRLLRGNGLLVKEITDSQGNFIHFPGVSDGEWQQDLTGTFYACTRFVCQASCFINDLACFSFVVQPDGLYWADDDGFGMTMDNEIKLYSLFDKNGDFVQPFSDKRPDGYDGFTL